MFMKNFFMFLSLATFIYGGGLKIPALSKIEDLKPVSNEILKSFYIGAGAGMSQVESDIYNQENIAHITLSLGYEYSKNIAVEARVVKGFSEKDYLGHGYSYGLFLKPNYDISNNISVYGLLGYSKNRITLDRKTASQNRVDHETIQDSVSYGFGTTYQLNRNWKVFGDWIHWIDKSTQKREGRYSIKINTFSFGLSYHF